MAKQTRLRVLIGTGICLNPLMAFAQGIDAQELTIIGMGVSLPVVIVIVFLIAEALEDRRRFKLIERLIGEGRDIPSALLLKTKEQLTPIEQRLFELRRGVWLLFSGLGIAIALYLMSGDYKSAAWGLVFVFLSGASFVNATFLKAVTPGNEGATSQK